MCICVYVHIYTCVETCTYKHTHQHLYSYTEKEQGPVRSLSQGNQRNERCELPIYLENLERSRDFKGSLLTKGHFPPGATSLSLVGLFFHVPNFFLRLQFIAFSLLKESTRYMFAVETGSSAHAGPWRLRKEGEVVRVLDHSASLDKSTCLA